MNRIPFRATGAAAAAALLLTACAAARVDGEWSSPQFSGSSLQGRTVMVSCRALDDTIRRICEDRLAARVAAGGARPVRAPEPPAGGQQTGDDLALAAARSAGAHALVRMTLMSSGATAGGFGGPSIGIGLGGGGGRFGLGGGISLPIGGSRITEAYSASTSVVDVGSGQPIWSVRTSTPGSSDLAEQVDQLARTTADAMGKAGLLQTP